MRKLRGGPRCRHVPVVVVSPSPADVDRRNSLRLGADAYFRKPNDLTDYEELVNVVKAFINDREKGWDHSTLRPGYKNFVKPAVARLPYTLGRSHMSSPWERLLERPRSGEHFVQVYESDESGLARNVCLYIWKGLQLGDGILLVTTPEHTQLFSTGLEKLGADVPALLAARQLVFFDAQQTMAKFMVSGQPDWERFEHVISTAMREVKPAEGSTGFRAYGEMVGVLWKARKFAAAIRVEQLWNKLLEQSSFSLYCAYAIDIFGKEFDVATLDGVLCSHTHMVPGQPEGTLEARPQQVHRRDLWPGCGCIADPDQIQGTRRVGGHARRRRHDAVAAQESAR